MDAEAALRGPHEGQVFVLQGKPFRGEWTDSAVPA